MSPKPGLELEPQPEPETETELETPENRKRQLEKYLGPARVASTWSSARNGGLPDLASAPDQPLKR